MSLEKKHQKRDHWEDISLSLSSDDSSVPSSVPAAEPAATKQVAQITVKQTVLEQTMESLQESMEMNSDKSQKQDSANQNAGSEQSPGRRRDPWSSLAAQLGLISSPIAPEVAEAASKLPRHSKQQDEKQQEEQFLDKKVACDSRTEDILSVAKPCSPQLKTGVHEQHDDAELPSVLWEPKKANLKKPEPAPAPVVPVSEVSEKLENAPVHERQERQTSEYSSGSSRRERHPRRENGRENSREETRDDVRGSREDIVEKTERFEKKEPVASQERAPRRDDRARRDDREDSRRDDTQRRDNNRRGSHLEEPRNEFHENKRDSERVSDSHAEPIADREKKQERPRFRNDRDTRTGRDHVEKSRESVVTQPSVESSWKQDEERTSSDDNRNSENQRRRRRSPQNEAETVERTPAPRKSEESPRRHDEKRTEEKRHDERKADVSSPLPDFSQIHKTIPSWDDAIGLIIDENMSRQPNRTGGGGHRGGGRGRRR